MVPVIIWFPLDVEIAVAQPVLHPISGACAVCSFTDCVSPLYQTSSIRTLVTYGGQFLDPVSGVDVTCSVAYESSRSEVAAVTERL